MVPGQVPPPLASLSICNWSFFIQWASSPKTFYVTTFGFKSLLLPWFLITDPLNSDFILGNCVLPSQLLSVGNLATMTSPPSFCAISQPHKPWQLREDTGDQSFAMQDWDLFGLICQPSSTPVASTPQGEGCVRWLLPLAKAKEDYHNAASLLTWLWPCAHLS